MSWDTKDPVSALTSLMPESHHLCRGGKHVLQPFKRGRRSLLLHQTQKLCFFITNAADYRFVQADGHWPKWKDFFYFPSAKLYFNNCCSSIHECWIIYIKYVTGSEKVKAPSFCIHFPFTVSLKRNGRQQTSWGAAWVKSYMSALFPRGPCSLETELE